MKELNLSVESLQSQTKLLAVTRAEYEALDPPDADTVYVIKDE